MADVLSKAQRSYCMSRIRSKDTTPELRIRSMLHRMGYRFRLHRRDLPGRPDLVFPAKRKVVFVHGCYWHQHSCRFGQVVPKTNTEFWQRKRAGNVQRDKANIRQLRKLGWKPLVIWECEMRDPDRVRHRLVRFLGEATR